MRKPRPAYGALLAAFLVLGSGASAQNPPAAPAAGSVRITFLPPPLEGTLSAGVYRPDGKLVRTLVRDATEREFTVGLNGLITHWDGKDDAGKALPAGKYFVRGFAVGAIAVEGDAFHGNDWLSEDEAAPRVIDILAMQMEGTELLLAARGLGAKDCIIHLPRGSAGVTFETFERASLSSDASIPRFSSRGAKALATKSLTVESPAQASSPGKGGTLWAIEAVSGDASGRKKVVQRSPDGGEILRELEFEADEPQPTAIAAAPDRDEIYLLERDPTEIRVRGLRLKKTEKGGDGKTISEWELFVSKSIRLFPSFEEFVPHLKRTTPPQRTDKVRVTLVSNELLSVAPAALQVSVGTDAEGSFLQTTDGLLLRRITDTPQLRWAALATEQDGTVSLFQSDGAVVEEYRLRQLDQMMAFDAGDYELAGAK